MAIQELARPPLGVVAKQIYVNQLRGDRLSHHGGPWDDYGRSIASYEKSFTAVLGGRKIKDLLKDRENPVIIDLMAPSGALATLLPKLSGKEKFGLAVSLEDLRIKKEKRRDAKLNIVQIPGDIMEHSTWCEIEKQLQGRKADLIMVRPFCGFNCIPIIPKLYAALLSKVWSLLKKEKGIFITQLPYGFSNQAEEMLNGFRKNIEIEALIGKTLRHTPSMKIVRTPNSPEKLPFSR
jgi:hypothetical protein